MKFFLITLTMVIGCATTKEAELANIPGNDPIELRELLFIGPFQEGQVECITSRSPNSTDGLIRYCSGFSGPVYIVFGDDPSANYTQLSLSFKNMSMIFSDDTATHTVDGKAKVDIDKITLKEGKEMRTRGAYFDDQLVFNNWAGWILENTIYHDVVTPLDDRGNSDSAAPIKSKERTLPPIK